MTRKQIRLLLLAFVSLTVLAVLAFLWAINLNQPEELRRVLTTYLLIIGSFALVTLGVFFLRAEVFDEEGKLERGRILTMTTAVLLIAQLTFAFASYAYRQMDITFLGMDHARALFAQAQEELYQGGSTLEQGGAAMDRALAEYAGTYPEIDQVAVLDRESTVLFSSDPAQEGTVLETDPVAYHRFPIGDQVVAMHISEAYQEQTTGDILSELLTVMAASVFLTIELMLFALKVLENKTDPPKVIDGKKPCMALSYVRQIAFLFYFASQLASSFLSVRARELGGSLLGLTGNVLAGIPQSAETLLTCVAILFTAVLIERKGWKLPFAAGLGLVALGSLASAFAPTILIYIAARALVGLGYGFCWMTLRNFALFGRNEAEKSEGFSLLNAGLYAGINCGSVLGSILAEKLGYSLVFVLAACFTLLCGLAIIRMENAVYVRPELPAPDPQAAKGRAGGREWLVVVLFVALMIAPACISASYLSYFLPIYFTDIGHTVSDVGRAQLLYGLLIIYAGPWLARLMGRRPALGAWNLAYNLVLAGGFVLFGLLGGFLPAMAAVFLLGCGDSFGFVAQNNYFLKLPLVQKLGESTSLSALSLVKKLLEMLGPITFGLALGGGSWGVLVLGAVFGGGAAAYTLLVGRRAGVAPEK